MNKFVAIEEKNIKSLIYENTADKSGTLGY